MFRRTFDASDEMTDPLEIETASCFSLEQVADHSRDAASFRASAAVKRVSLFLGKTDGKSRFHGKKISCL